MKTKPVPSIIMLAAGFVRCVIGVIYQQDLTSFFWSLIRIMILFYIVGILVKIVLDKNFPPEKEEEIITEETPEGETENFEEESLGSMDDSEESFVKEKDLQMAFDGEEESEEQ